MALVLWAVFENVYEQTGVAQVPRVVQRWAAPSAQRPPWTYGCLAKLHSVVGCEPFVQNAVEEGWDQPAPYQVELEDGTLIFAPIDEDWVIRKQLKTA